MTDILRWEFSKYNKV